MAQRCYVREHEAKDESPGCQDRGKPGGVPAQTASVPRCIAPGKRPGRLPFLRLTEHHRDAEPRRWRLGAPVFKSRRKINFGA